MYTPRDKIYTGIKDIETAVSMLRCRRNGMDGDGRTTAISQNTPDVGVSGSSLLESEEPQF